MVSKKRENFSGQIGSSELKEPVVKIASKSKTASLLTNLSILDLLPAFILPVEISTGIFITLP
jgi:hypothetical protein